MKTALIGLVAACVLFVSRPAHADYPSCDTVGDHFELTHCMANCCATHDEWYAAIGCTESSWFDLITLIAQAIPQLRAVGEMVDDGWTNGQLLTACVEHPDVCGTALIQALASPICAYANMGAVVCFAGCASGVTGEPATNTCVDAGRTWESSDPKCCDDPFTGGSGPNPSYCPTPSCPGSCGALTQRPYPDCGCYCPNECGPLQTRDANDCGCFCNFTCSPPYVQAADCSCVSPEDPCNGVTCDRGANDHCVDGSCQCSPRSCGDVCSGIYGIVFAGDGCGTTLSCSCGCQPGCDLGCDAQTGACPDQGCGPGIPPPDSCGVCGGDGSSCACQWYDCNGTCNGGAQVDCNGTCGGSAQVDACGVCGGDGTSCQCNPDECGVCGGDGSSCACQWYDCNGTCNGGADYDQCGVCGGDGSSCGGGDPGCGAGCGGGCGYGCGYGCGGGGCGGGCGGSGIEYPDIGG